MTRRASPVSPPVCLTIAGSDSGGGAGIQADIKTMEAHGAFATSVVTSVTAQNTQGVTSSYTLPVAEIEAQYDAVVSDFDVRVVKTGMLGTAEVVEAVADRLADFDAPLVVDPVMVATSGDRLLESAAESAYEQLVAQATLVTPNADEATVLTGVEIATPADAIEAGERLVEMGADAAFVKGGHLSGATVVDVLVADEVTRFTHPRVETDATHGSGCTLSSAIAARLAQGDALADAVGTGVSFMTRAVRYPLDVGEGPGAVHHLVDLRNRAAREETAEAVEGIVEQFVARDVSALVPEIGMNVVGATPFAEAVSETAAVEGRITRTLSGVKPNRGVRFGASSHVARFLLGARESVPNLRFAVNCRFDDEVEAALSELEWPLAEFDRSVEPEDVKAREGNTMGWGARRAFGGAGETPIAVIDRGEVGKEPIVKLVAEDAETLAERVFALLAALD
ncbi:bifunctional hydroxymethylpyrimidine kinase/phosphomethylpyrimidine kinase [Haladaptatus sp. DYSN1]|uniref:bifunctional hydroxymethylpyrimidine kinase/phosphomethylpyrimidine kinase n=1 Tax=unclassified Haladaptatus TaxID=2622732 RepID=UPI0024065E46|nr:bifunctional hydroxymethylpyrimidine kinase/phosphomethylpyrimidine kinase [Haladaptatus sp. DYSN1]